MNDFSHHCIICDKFIVKSQRARHERTEVHVKNASKVSSEAEAAPQPEPLPSHEETNDNIDVDDDENDLVEDDFLSDMNQLNFKPTVVTPKPMKPVKEPKIKVAKTPIDDDIDPLFSNIPTQLLGSDRLLLISKIKNYKLLFPKELKTFKIKKNPSIKELNDALEEIDTLISVGNVDSFITCSLLEGIHLIEGLTSRTKYNISGLSDILKANPNFNSLCRQLYLKYGSFGNVPPEYQICFIIATSTYICIQKNNNKEKMNSFLNSPLSS